MFRPVLRSVAIVALGAAAAAAQPVAPDPGVIAIRLFSAVPNQPSAVFRPATESDFEVEAVQNDRTPYRVAPTFVGTITAAAGTRVTLAGDPAGTAPFSIDNFLLFEIGEPAQRIL